MLIFVYRMNVNGVKDSYCSCSSAQKILYVEGGVWSDSWRLSRMYIEDVEKYIGKYFESISKGIEEEMSTVYFNIMRVSFEWRPVFL